MPRWVLAALAACSVSALLAVEAQAADRELHTLVPRGAGLYAEIRQLGGGLQALEGSELLTRVENYPPVAQWRQKDLPALRIVAAAVALQFGINAEELTERLLAASAAVAIYPQVPGQPPVAPPEDDPSAFTGAGLVLLDVGDAALVEQVFQGINRLTRQSGELVGLDEGRHAGLAYHVRTVVRGGERSQEYWALIEGIVAVSNSEALLKQVLAAAAEQDGAAGVSTGLPDEAQRLWQQLDQHAMLRAVVVAEPWRAWLEQRRPALEAAGEDHSGAESLLSLGEAVAVGLRLGPEISADVYVGLTPEAWPVAWRTWWENLRRDETAAIDQWLGRVPADALLVVYGRFDVAAVLKAAWQWNDGSHQRELTRLSAAVSAITEVEHAERDYWPRLNPSVQLSVEPPLEQSPSILPDVVARWGFTPDDGSEPIHAAAARLLDWLWTTAAVAANAELPLERIVAEPVRVHRAASGRSATLRHLGGPPDWLEPTYFVGEQGVVFSNSAKRAEAAETAAPEESLREALSAEDRPAAAHGVWMRINLSACRAYLHEHRTGLTRLLADARRVPDDRADRAVGQLLSVLQLADSITLTSRVDGSTAWIGLRVAAGPRDY